MRKTLIFIFAVAIICLSGCNSKHISSQIDSTSSTFEKSATEIETTQETSGFDYSTLSNEDFANKLAEDFSTDEVVFTSEKYDDDLYFLRCENDSINIHIGFSDYGKNISISFVTDGEDECYYVLLKALQSEVFNISFDDQVDILAQYTVDTIDYEQENLSITETINENIRVIGIQLQ